MKSKFHQKKNKNKHCNPTRARRLVSPALPFIACAMVDSTICSGSAAALSSRLSSRRAALFASRRCCLFASPLASLRRWASLRLCDAARLNADRRRSGLDGCSFLSLLPLSFLRSHTPLPLYRRSSSPPLFAASPRFVASLLSLPFYAVRLFSLRHRSCLCRSAPLFALGSFLAFFASALRSCEGINRQCVCMWMCTALC